MTREDEVDQPLFRAAVEGMLIGLRDNPSAHSAASISAIASAAIAALAPAEEMASLQQPDERLIVPTITTPGTARPDLEPVRRAAEAWVAMRGYAAHEAHCDSSERYRAALIKEDAARAAFDTALSALAGPQPSKEEGEPSAEAKARVAVLNIRAKLPDGRYLHSEDEAQQIVFKIITLAGPQDGGTGKIVQRLDLIHSAARRLGVYADMTPNMRFECIDQHASAIKLALASPAAEGEG